MSISLSSLSGLLSGLGGAAGVAGVICSLVGASPSSSVGKAVEAVVSGALVLIAHWHASSVVSARAKAPPAPRPAPKPLE